jgi:hypothetical protein
MTHRATSRQGAEPTFISVGAPSGDAGGRKTIYLKPSNLRFRWTMLPLTDVCSRRCAPTEKPRAPAADSVGRQPQHVLGIVQLRQA